MFYILEYIPLCPVVRVSLTILFSCRIVSFLLKGKLAECVDMLQGSLRLIDI